MTFYVVIFIYQSASKYFDALINSLNAQTDLNFEVILFNDDFSNAKLVFSKLKMRYQIVNLTSKTPLGLRFEGLEQLRNFTNSFFIFQDCDDLLESTRVNVVKHYAKYYKLITNDLTIINEKGDVINENIWRSRIDKTEFVGDSLLECNFVGLGNTSFHFDLLEYIPSKPITKLVAVDWYIFFNILNESKIKGYFTSDTTTLYRQHNENSIGIANENSIAKIIETRNAFFQLIRHNKYSKSNIMYDLPTTVPHNFPFWWELIPKIN